MRYSYALLIAIFTAFSIVMCSFNAHSFVDPSSGIMIPELGPGWTKKFGFGHGIAKYQSKNDGKLTIRWSDGKMATLKFAMANQYGGARILSSRHDIDGRNTSEITFEVGDLMGMALIRSVPPKPNTIEVFCIAPDGDHLEMAIACRRVASGMEIGQPSGKAVVGKLGIPSLDSLNKMRAFYDADPSNMSLAVELVLSRYLFSILDGRYGCNFLTEGLLRMSGRLLKNGDDALANNLSALAKKADGGLYPEFDDISWFAGESVKRILNAIEMEKSGRVNSARSRYEKLMRDGHRYFAALRLIKIDLEDGDVGGASKNMALFDAQEGGDLDSGFASALRLWLLRDEFGDIPQSQMKLNGDAVCGESTAIHARQLGFLMMQVDPLKAAQYFSQAIEADPSYVPAYVSLGRALLGGGSGTRASVGELKRLLARAPQTSEIRKLSARLDNWHPNNDRR